MPRKRLAIPRRVKVRGRTWRVKASRTLRRREGAVGLCEPETRTITIYARLPRREKEKTFVHELLHAIWPEGVVPGDVEEKLILRLEAGLLDLVQSGALTVVPEEIKP